MSKAVGELRSNGRDFPEKNLGFRILSAQMLKDTELEVRPVVARLSHNSLLISGFRILKPVHVLIHTRQPTPRLRVVGLHLSCPP